MGGGASRWSAGGRRRLGAGLVPVLVLVGGLLGCSPDGERPPIGDVAWDGEQFVVSNDVVDEEGRAYWTSPDGIDWERHEGYSMAAPPSGCVHDFPCSVSLGDVEDVPFHFPDGSTRLVAGREDLLLQEVGVGYDFKAPTESGLPELHPALLAEAARDSACFTRLFENVQTAQPPSQRAEDPYVASWSSDGRSISVSCAAGGQSDRFTLDLTEHLDAYQLKLLAGGVAPRLVATRPPDEVSPVRDPPTTTWIDDQLQEQTTLSAIGATSTRFWSVDEDTLVSSIDGVTWEPVDLDTGGWEPSSVVANLGGDVVVSLIDPAAPAPEGFIQRLPSHLIVTHDDGASWSPPIEVEGGFWSIADVGPAGVAVVGSDDDLLIIDDRIGEVAFTIGDRMSGLLGDVGIGRTAVVVPQIVAGADGSEAAFFEVYDLAGALVDTVG